MIIDAHAHIIPQIRGQKEGKKTSGLRYGQVNIGDEAVQMLPGYLERSEFTPEMLIAMMDSHDVERAVLLQNPTYGIINDEIALAINNYPERFIGTIQVDPGKAGVIETIQKYYSHNQRILKLEMSQGWGWTGVYPELKLDGPELDGAWELMEEKKMAVIIDPGPINNPGYQVEAIDKLSDRYGNIRFLIEHLGYMTPDQYGNPSSQQRWESMILLARKDNVSMGCSAIQAVMEEDYPCAVSMGLIHKAVRLIGSENLIWGSDIPTTLGNYTYKQQIQMINELADYLSDKEKERMLGDNAGDFLFGS